MIKVLLILLLHFVSNFAFAENFEECRQFFAHTKIPVINNSQALMPRALCFSSFAILHSGISRTPIYVAERLNRQALLSAKENQRKNKFFPDARLPRSERSEITDYRGSGYDRGHMAPAGDMPTEEAMAQSFSLANIVPQSAINNRKAWANIEKATRKYAMRSNGDVFVITGPIFDSSRATIGENKVWIPKFLFKLVYDPGTGRSWVHWIENSDNAKVSKPITYEELVNRSGIQFLPM